MGDLMAAAVVCHAAVCPIAAVSNQSGWMGGRTGSCWTGLLLLVPIRYSPKINSNGSFEAKINKFGLMGGGDTVALSGRKCFKIWVFPKVSIDCMTPVIAFLEDVVGTDCCFCS